MLTLQFASIVKTLSFHAGFLTLSCSPFCLLVVAVTAVGNCHYPHVSVPRYISTFITMIGV